MLDSLCSRTSEGILIKRWRSYFTERMLSCLFLRVKFTLGVARPEFGWHTGETDLLSGRESEILILIFKKKQDHKSVVDVSMVKVDSQSCLVYE